MGQFFSFCSCRVIVLAYFFGKMALITNNNGEIYLWSSAINNALLYESGNSLADKIEEKITFALRNAHLYLAESDDEQDDNSDASNTLYISYGSLVSSSSLSAITVSVLATHDVFCCWIFTSNLFLPNDTLPSDYMVDWDNDSMLGIGGRDTNIDAGSFML